MKVTYIGFGGGFTEYPCYKDQKGKIYFDINNGRGDIELYTGAYRHPEDRDICGEPCEPVTEPVECENPFKRHLREHDYRMLGRYVADCKYFLGNGNGYEGHLYFKEVNKHCDEIKKLYHSFSEEDKPGWLTEEQIETYQKEMLKVDFMKKHFMDITEINEETVTSMDGADGIIISNSNGKVIDIGIHDKKSFTEDGFPLYWLVSVWDSYENYLSGTGSIEYEELMADFTVEKLKNYVSM